MCTVLRMIVSDEGPPLLLGARVRRGMALLSAVPARRSHLRRRLVLSCRCPLGSRITTTRPLPGAPERDHWKIKAKTIIYETRNYRRRTDRRMQKWMTHNIIHKRTFQNIYNSKRMARKRVPASVIRYRGLASENAALAAAAAQARGHICPKGGP